MSPENDSRITYLRDLKNHSADSDAATAPLTPSRKERPKGAERRRSSRYKCEGKVEMRDDISGMQTWAVFTDVGMFGCYVETRATFPAGTILRLKMEAAGVRFESKAEVRITYPYQGMGVAFVELTVENQSRLKQLLEALFQPPSLLETAVIPAHPSDFPTNGAPVISDPGAAVQTLLRYFETRHILTREDFQNLLRKSQFSQG
jgi:hypothetical protein